MKKRFILLGILAGLAGASLASAQLPQGGFQRFGGPLLYDFSYRPFATFSNGQFTGYGYIGPYLLVPPPGYTLPSFLQPGQMASGVQPMGIPTVGDTGSSGAFAIARTNDTVDSQFDKDGSLLVRWDGQSAAVRAITFAILDGTRKELKSINVEKLPAEGRFEAPGKAEFLFAQIEYVNGTTVSVTTAIKAPTVETKTDAGGEKKPDQKANGKSDTKPEDRSK